MAPLVCTGCRGDRGTPRPPAGPRREWGASPSASEGQASRRSRRSRPDEPIADSSPRLTSGWSGLADAPRGADESESPDPARGSRPEWPRPRRVRRCARTETPAVPARAPRQGARRSASRRPRARAGARPAPPRNASPLAQRRRQRRLTGQGGEPLGDLHGVRPLRGLEHEAVDAEPERRGRRRQAGQRHHERQRPQPPGVVRFPAERPARGRRHPGARQDAAPRARRRRARSPRGKRAGESPEAARTSNQDRTPRSSSVRH